MTAIVGIAGVLALSSSQALTPSVAFAQGDGDNQAQQGSPPLISPTAPAFPTPLPFPLPSLNGVYPTGAPGGTGPYGLTSSAGLAASGIPEPARAAYVAAAAQLAISDPSCQLSWTLIAGIGRVESNHGRYGGSTIRSDGLVTPPILGIKLDGSRPGTARISDTDNGRYDGDTVTDRAVGPMQFLPGTWKVYGAGGNPQNMNAAALATGKYLCAGSGSLATQQGRWAAVYRYNHSDSYVSLVLSLADSYASGGTVPFPTRPTGTVTPGTTQPATTPGTPPSIPEPTTPEPKPTKPKPTTKPTSSPKPTTPKPTASPKPTTSSPSPTRTTNSPTPTRTTTPTTSPTQSPTPTPTKLPTCPTATPTPTPTPTATPTPSPTCTPADNGQAAPGATPTASPTK